MLRTQVSTRVVGNASHPNRLADVQKAIRKHQPGEIDTWPDNTLHAIAAST